MWAFLASPAARYLAAAVLSLIFVGSVYGYGYLEGKKAADQSARIAELERDSRDLKRERDTARAERDKVRKDAEAANEIAAEAAKREQTAQAENDELEGMVSEFKKLLSENANRSCGFDARQLERLRPIYDRALGRGSEASPTRSPDMAGPAGQDRSPHSGR